MNLSSIRRSAWITATVFSTMLASTPPELAAQGRADASAGGATVGALAGGALGLILGAHAGANSGDCYEICERVVIGAIAGEIVGTALGAHAGNGGRGRLLPVLGVSAAIPLSGLVLQSMVGGGGTDGLFWASTAAQIVGVVVTEVRTSPSLRVRPELRPTEDGMAVGLGLRW